MVVINPRGLGEGWESGIRSRWDGDPDIVTLRRDEGVGWGGEAMVTTPSGLGDGIT